MTETPAFARPAPMERGSYNRNSRVQAAGLLPTVALLEQAAQVATLPPAPQPVVIADYGCSAGRNALVPMGTALAVLRRRLGPEQPVSIVHTDLPDNDFTALFQTLATDPDSYLRADPAVFASAIGRSFYEQLLPTGSVSLGWSSWAVQWLSRVPALIPDQVQAAATADLDARAAFTRQAAEDWRLFLAARSRELHAGGRLVVLTMATDDDGDFGYRPVLDAIFAALTEMVRTGFLGAEELRRMAIPTVGRNHAEFAAPFSDGSLPGLALERLEIFQGDDRIWTQFQAGGDAQAFGAQWAAFSRASVFPTLAAALEGGHGDPRSADFRDRLEAGMAARLSAAPAPMLMPLAQMVMVKEEA